MFFTVREVIMIKRRTGTYTDKLFEDEKFKKGVEKEYAKLCISEGIAKARYEAKLTQATLARKIKTSKSAISRYESGNYGRYSIPLLRRIASACDAKLEIKFIPKRKKK